MRLTRTMQGGGRGGRRRAAGLTILEMLVSSAMLALIIVGLTAMFVQTQKAFKTGIKQTDVGDAGRAIADMIAGDLSQASDGTPFGLFDNVNSGMTNFMWGWSAGDNYPQEENGAVFRTNQIQRLYILVQTNTGWTGVGYAVSNMVPGLGVGTLYRYTSPTNAHFIDNHYLYDPFKAVFHPNFPQVSGPGIMTTNIRLSRVADGVVDLRVMAYDRFGNRIGYETNNGFGDFYEGSITNRYPFWQQVPGTSPIQYVTNTLPYAVDLELGILDPDAWDHLRGLAGNLAAQSNYLKGVSGKIDVFRKHILVRAASLQ